MRPEVPLTEVHRRHRDLEAAGRSHAGAVRRQNEDLFVCAPEHGLFAVVDGMGGARAGQVAARLTFDTLLEEPGADLRDLLDRAHHRIHARGSREGAEEGMGCVATVVRIAPNGALSLAHVGDTRALVASRTGCEQLTRDHTVVADLEENLAMTEAEAGRLPGRHRVTRDLGGRVHPDASWIDIGESRLEPRDLLLLCSDGLSDLVRDRELFALLEGARQHGTPAAEVVAELVDLALERGAPDNVTAVVVRRRRTVEPADEVETTAVVAVDPAALEPSPAPARRRETGSARVRQRGGGFRGSLWVALVAALLGLAVGWYLSAGSTAVPGPDSGGPVETLESHPEGTEVTRSLSGALAQQGVAADGSSLSRGFGLRLPAREILTIDGGRWNSAPGGTVLLELGPGAALHWSGLDLDRPDLELKATLGVGAVVRFEGARLRLAAVVLEGDPSARLELIDTPLELTTPLRSSGPEIRRSSTEESAGPTTEPAPPPSPSSPAEDADDSPDPAQPSTTPATPPPPLPEGDV